MDGQTDVVTTLTLNRGDNKNYGQIDGKIDRHDHFGKSTPTTFITPLYKCHVMPHNAQIQKFYLYFKEEKVCIIAIQVIHLQSQNFCFCALCGMTWHFNH